MRKTSQTRAQALILTIVAIALLCACSPPVTWTTPPDASLHSYAGGAVETLLSPQQREAIDDIMAAAEEIDPPQTPYSPPAHASYAVIAPGGVERLYADAVNGWAVLESRANDTLRYHYFVAPGLLSLLKGYATPPTPAPLSGIARVDPLDVAAAGKALNWQVAQVDPPPAPGFYAAVKADHLILTAAYESAPDAIAVIDRLEICDTIIKVSTRVLAAHGTTGDALIWSAITCPVEGLPNKPIVFVDEAQQVLGVCER